MSENSQHQQENLEGFRSHPRHYQGRQLVYPVLTRRGGGISVGVNLSPEKVCNFNCVYCQVDRDDCGDGPVSFSLKVLDSELRETIGQIKSGQIYQFQPFCGASEELRRFNDIALSGDGEPAASEHFSESCRLIARLKGELALPGVKIVLITNASCLHLERVREGLEILRQNQGQIWAKLDAGTEDYYREVNNSDVPFKRILENLLLTARKQEIVIQTLFMNIDGQSPTYAEIEAYVERLREILDGGGRIAGIQLHTIARPPRLAKVSMLRAEQLDDIADQIRKAVDLPLGVYYG